MPATENNKQNAVGNQPGELVKLLRKLKGIKQDVAARKLGVKQQAVSKLENCKIISRKKFDEIVAAFNFTQEEVEMAKKFLPPPPPR
jgi:transcriptional regulator with XRE-family HTH domain